MKVVTDLNPSNTYVNASALNIKDKFTELFRRYSICHMQFNSKSYVDHQILGKIVRFLHSEFMNLKELEQFLVG
jgi:hypothetical protein